MLTERTKRVLHSRFLTFCGFSVDDVPSNGPTAERFLTASSQQGKATPWQATTEFVGEKHDAGAGQVEKIWQDYRNARPDEEKRNRRKTPTTPAAERTA